MNRTRRHKLKKDGDEVVEKRKSKKILKKNGLSKKKKMIKQAEAVIKEEPDISILELITGSDTDNDGKEDNVIELTSSATESASSQTKILVEQSEEQSEVCAVEADQVLSKVDSTSSADSRSDTTLLHTEALAIPQELLAEFKRGYITTAVYLDETNTLQAIDMQKATVSTATLDTP